MSILDYHSDTNPMLALYTYFRLAFYTYLRLAFYTYLRQFLLPKANVLLVRTLQKACFTLG